MSYQLLNSESYTYIRRLPTSNLAGINLSLEMKVQRQQISPHFALPWTTAVYQSRPTSPLPPKAAN